MDELVFHYYEEPEPELAGVTVGYLYSWSGEPGPAKVIQVAMVNDGDFGGFIQATGEWSDCIVTAD